METSTSRLPSRSTTPSKCKRGLRVTPTAHQRPSLLGRRSSLINKSALASVRLLHNLHHHLPILPRNSLNHVRLLHRTRRIPLRIPERSLNACPHRCIHPH